MKNMSQYECPLCGAHIEYLDYKCNYWEKQATYGRAEGTYDLDEQEHQMDDTYENGVDDTWDYEENDHEYSCPKCESTIRNPDDLKMVEPGSITDKKAEDAKKMLNSFKEYEKTINNK